MRRTDRRLPQSSPLETPLAALAGASTRGQPRPGSPLNASRAHGSIRQGQAALGPRPLRLAHHFRVERVAVSVTDDVASLAELGVRIIDGPSWREAARIGTAKLKRR